MQGYRKHLIFTSVFTLNREYLLVTGAFAVLKQARAHPEKYPWTVSMQASRCLRLQSPTRRRAYRSGGADQEGGLPCSDECCGLKSESSVMQ